MNWNCDDPDGYCWMPPTPALSPAFGAGSQPEHANVREPWLAPNFMAYMSSASPATIESATVSSTYVYYKYCYTYQTTHTGFDRYAMIIPASTSVYMMLF
jgi:hypothetical protein